MNSAQEGFRSGEEYLETVTELLHRIRCADPFAGLYEAAEVQWWWAQRARSTDEVGQLFWFDDAGRPVVAVVLTSFGAQTQIDPIVMPDASPDWRTHVMDRGLAHAAELGIESVYLELDAADDVLTSFLVTRGFEVEPGGGLVESWMDPAARPPVSPLADGYRLSTRLEHPTEPHHMANDSRGHPDPEQRLRQTSLYRPDLDLVVHDADGAVAAYGLFWHDPVTGVGVSEPMRTEDAHQQRGLARHVLTAGIERLVAVGAQRIKICFEPGNAASSHLYLDVGFTPARHNHMCSGPTARPPSS